MKLNTFVSITKDIMDENSKNWISLGALVESCQRHGKKWWTDGEID